MSTHPGSTSTDFVTMRRSVLLFVPLAVTAGLCLSDVVPGAEPFEAFLVKHCVRCHGPQGEEGNLRMDRLSRDFMSGLDTHLWAEVVERVNSGEMPPETEPRPTQDEIAAFVGSLDALMKEGRAARMATTSGQTRLPSRR